MKRKTWIILGIALAALVAAGIYACTLFALPAGCSSVSVQTYCAKVSDTGEILSLGGKADVFSRFTEDAPWQCRYVAFLLRTMRCEETAELPADAQIVEISFSDYAPQSGVETLWKEYIAFDFYTEKLYVFRDGRWYSMKERRSFDKFVETNMNASLGYGAAWRGQSTYAPEEYVETDFENAVFRYHLRWKQSEDVLRERYHLQTDGFAALPQTDIRTGQDAVDRAAQVLHYGDPKGVAMYDETCGFWMVELYENSAQYEDLPLTEFTEALHGNIKTVILDGSGTVLEVYDSVTRYAAFQEN